MDAVCISVIHPHHARWAMAAAEAGKHVLVEEPMAMTSAEAERMIESARRHDVFLMEAFMYRCHPLDVQLRDGSRLFDPAGVDMFTAATLTYPGGIVAELVCGVSCQMPVEATVVGTKGRLTLPNPWLPSSPARRAMKPLPAGTRWPSEKILLWAGDQAAPTEIVVDADRDLYGYEADTVDEHAPDRQSPAMSWDDSLGNMRLLDRWRAELGSAA